MRGRNCRRRFRADVALMSFAAAEPSQLDTLEAALEDHGKVKDTDDRTDGDKGTAE